MQTRLAAKERKELFARPASGLVREISTARATFYDIAGTVGNSAAIPLAYVALFPVITFLGLPTISWTLLISGIFTGLIILCYAALTSAMPRSGGDYVYTTRIMHPYLGWMEGWTMCWGAVALLGYNAWAAVYNIGILALQGIVIPGSSSYYSNLAAFLFQPNVLLIGGAIEFILVFLINLMPPRIYHTIVSVFIAASVASCVLLFVPLIGVSQATFAANLHQYTNMTGDQIIAAAKTAGWDPNYFNWNAVASSFGFGIFAFVGFNFSSYFAGELKGNLQKNVIISLTVAILVALPLYSIFLLPFFSVMSPNVSNAWGYLFWNAPSQAPLQAAPITTLITSIANPSMAWYSMIVGFFALVVFNFILLVAYVGLTTRITFAQAMDRFWPKQFASVGKRTHQPIYLIIFWCVFGFLMHVAEVYGFSPATGVWFSVLLFFLTFLMPAVNAIFISRRRPDLYELTPSWVRKKVLGVPKLVWFGAIYVAFLIPVYVGTEFWPLIASLTATPISGFYNYILTTGIMLWVTLLIIGTVWYFTAHEVQRRRGIDVDMLFKSIPPE